MTTTPKSQFHGYVIVDKPAGWTSHDVVARVRRLSHQRSAGHAGTLDPAATGVLPIALGDATKTLRFLESSTKTYLAEITLGVETDSYDIDGRAVEFRQVPQYSRADIESALKPFEGTFDQVVPKYSAVQKDGVRLHEMARAGVTVDLPVRKVTIFQLKLVDWDRPVFSVLVDCSKGTYIRSLAHDLGTALGTGAYLSNLVRLRSGPFGLCESWTLRDLERIELALQFPSIAIHPDRVLEQFDAAVLDRVSIGRWMHGNAVETSTLHETSWTRTYDFMGNWLGFGESVASSSTLSPKKVVHPPKETGWNGNVIGS